MFQVYNHVYVTESRTAKYQIGEDEKMKMTKQVKNQSLLYVSVHTACYFALCSLLIIYYHVGTILLCCMDVPNYRAVRVENDILSLIIVYIILTTLLTKS